MVQKLETAVLLVGGDGTRLSSMTHGKIPKPLIEVNGQPILYWSLDWLKKNGIKNVVFATADKTEQIRNYMDLNNNFGLTVSYSPNPTDSGTAGAFQRAIGSYVSDPVFVAMNGDELTNMDLREMANDK